jgi:hypothetical protein
MASKEQFNQDSSSHFESSPPASATTIQLELYDRILQNRTNQLDNLPLSHLKTIYGHLTASDRLNSTELWTCLSQVVPDMSPKNKSDYITLVREFLTMHFHNSIDTSIDPKIRQKALDCVRELFEILDLVHLGWLETLEQQQSESMNV